MEVHTCLWNDVAAFCFDEADLELITTELPGLDIRVHRDESEFLSQAATADVLLTWDFPHDWYAECPQLTQILTPAAGDDWIAPAPNDEVSVIHGTFHGEILAESLLHAILFMNHRMPLMIRNFESRQWDRNLQSNCRLLKDQTILIVGMGNIGKVCARVLAQTGAEVLGVRRRTSDANAGVYSIDDLDELLPRADHLVLMLPGTQATDRFMNPGRLEQLKPGAFIYNFGRGNALHTSDLIAAWSNLGGAFLDVTEVEPLPYDSPLWQLDNLMITPHSSCVYQNYKSAFLNEAISHLREIMS